MRRRWCPQAELVEGSFRGSTGQSIRREIRQICIELREKGADVFVFLTDQPREDWRATLGKNNKRVPAEHEHKTLCAIAHKEIEFWLCADPDYCVQQLGGTVQEWQNAAEAKDPEQLKGLFDSRAKKKWGEEWEQRREALAVFVANAGLKTWIQKSKSFERFFEDSRSLGRALGCEVRNERE